MAGDGFFGAEVAATYDRDHGGTDPAILQQTVEVLHNLADGGASLEFAIGTGRIALPLAARGTPVKGIELSAAMVDQMRRKPGGDDIYVCIGDMTQAQVAGDFALVFLVFNTIDNLTTQDSQVACFQNAAAHLPTGGRFVIETLVPPIQHIPYGETQRAFACSPAHWGIDTFDVTTQNYHSNHVWFEDGKDSAPNRISIPFRYTWPSELDLMARLAGLRFESRWADWQQAPFTRFSKSHISVWRKDPP